MDATNTVWHLEPHTRAKHEILRRYLAAWFPIVKNVNPSGLNYIDGFAGPGVYAGGEDGSPVIAIKTAVQHRLPMPKIFFAFIEKEKNRAETLRDVLAKRFPELPENIGYKVYNDEFATVIGSILDEFDAKSKVLAPTFTFVDPFGYAGFPLDLLKRLLKPRASEVLITFMASRLRRFLDETHESAVDNLFGSLDWRVARELSGSDRVQFLLNFYRERLLDATPARYVLTFEMVGRDGNTIYWLVFVTKHPKGCQAMKEAMWKVDPTGTYSFYDVADGVRRFLLDEGDPEWAKQAQQEVWEHFRGRRVKVEEVENFIAPTVFLWRKRRILVPLERSGKIVRVESRKRRLTHPNGCVITFAR
ncbi:MAG: three-Cys-motif partner protein TcmP [Thermoplasmata archaeon]